MNLDNISRLYLLYGFELVEEKSNCMIFSYTNGYFSNIEIVKLISCDVNNIKKNYEKLGFSVSVIEPTELNCIPQKLFSGFFSLKQYKNRIQKDYNRFCESQKRKLCCDSYQYLNCNYTIAGENYNEGLIDRVFQLLNSDEAQLIILEAAAGFGKTCASYEVLNRFSESSIRRIPLISELSRNRKASIFKYVLLSEIDRNFSALSVKVVEYEIRKGNVPLIIDGFDELLSKSVEYDSSTESFEEVQSMLDTIAQLLNGESKAKILITSRKSALFTGAEFDEWVENRGMTCPITRIELKTPQVKDWIGQEKTEILFDKKLRLDNIANPVLLSILREKDVQYIQQHTVLEIINEYFSVILKREQERQSLILNENEQMEILYRLASYFALLNISSEEGEFVKEIIKEIIGESIEEYVSRYSRFSFDSYENIPDEDQFLMKLLHHALLDRTTPGKNQIGFINDFIFGFLLGQAMCNNCLESLDKIDYKYIDLISTAYAVEGLDNKNVIKENILKSLPTFSINQQMDICNKLFHKTMMAYENESITNMVFTRDFCFSEDKIMKNCIFVDCIFDNCIFYDDSFYECQFYNCTFYNPQIIASAKKNENTLIFLGCNGHDVLAKSFAVDESAFEIKPNFERIVLEQFWKRGYESPEPRRAFTTIYKGIDNKDIVNIDKALKSLLRKEILIQKRVCYELNFSKMNEILALLGRNI